MTINPFLVAALCQTPSILYLVAAAAGETEIPIPTNITSVVSSIGTSGMLVWFAWYTQTRVLPKKDKDAKEERESAANRHTAQVSDIITRYLANSAEERAATHQARTDFMAALDRQAASYTEMNEGLRDRVHEQADLYQKSMSESTVRLYNAVEQMAMIGGVITQGNRKPRHDDLDKS